MLIDTLRERWAELTRLDEQIATIERRLKVWMKQDEAIAGVWLLEPPRRRWRPWATPRRSAPGASSLPTSAWCPKQSGSGGRVNLLGISKRGDVYLRTLLIHGARGRADTREGAQSLGWNRSASAGRPTWCSWRWPTRLPGPSGQYWRTSASMIKGTSV